MPIILREVTEPAKLEEHLALDRLGRVVPLALVEQVVTQTHCRERRRRKLPAVVMVYVCIALALFAQESIPAVMRQLVTGLRWCWPVRLTVSAGALCQARYRLGAQPLVQLCHAVCQPLTTDQTPGATYQGLRLLAVDGSKLDVPDTPANERAFGRPGVARGRAPFPQVLVVGLVECASHALIDAGIWPVRGNEHAAAQRLLRSLTPTSLLLYDAGLHSVELVTRVRQHGAQFLGRLPSHVHPRIHQRLSDGSALVTLDARPRSATPTLRLIRYTLDDPQRPGHRREHRLLTSLLDPDQSPARELILLYHQRWEFELGLDELVVHQRPRTPLRRHKPLGVIQELYALILAHYLLRALMVDAAATVDLPPVRLSFLATLRLVRLALPDVQRGAPSHHPQCSQHLRADIAAQVLPPRRDRLNPRVVKRAQSKFRVKRPHHRPSPKPTKPFADAIVLLN